MNIYVYSFGKCACDMEGWFFHCERCSQKFTGACVKAKHTRHPIQYPKQQRLTARLLSRWVSRQWYGIYNWRFVTLPNGGKKERETAFSSVNVVWMEKSKHVLQHMRTINHHPNTGSAGIQCNWCKAQCITMETSSRCVEYVLNDARV